MASINSILSNIASRSSIFTRSNVQRAARELTNNDDGGSDGDELDPEQERQRVALLQTAAAEDEQQDAEKEAKKSLLKQVAFQGIKKFLLWFVPAFGPWILLFLLFFLGYAWVHNKINSLLGGGGDTAEAYVDYATEHDCTFDDKECLKNLICENEREAYDRVLKTNPEQLGDFVCSEELPSGSGPVPE